MAEHDDGDITVVLEFNAAINARDLDRLTELMSPDHRFVDASGAAIEGREACGAAWASFFESFPDYRNVFDDIQLAEPGHVVASGWSDCAVAALRGSARWHAAVDRRSIREWRVEDPDPPPAGNI